MNNINQQLMNEADENNVQNSVRRLNEDVKMSSPVIARSFSAQNLPQEFISPSTPGGSVEPTDSSFTGSFVSGCGRIFTVNGIPVTINIGGVALGVLQVGMSQENGVFYAGEGNVILNKDGVTITEGSTGGKPGQYAPNALNFSDGSNIVSELAAYKSGSSGYRFLRLRTEVTSDVTKKGMIEIAVLDTAGTTTVYGIQIDGAGGFTFSGPSGSLLTVSDTLIDAKKQLDYLFIGARVYKNSGTQSINNVTATAVTFDAEVNDSDGFHDNATNNSRLTVPTGKAGEYNIIGLVQFATNATGYRQVQIRVNGTTVIGSFGSVAIPDAGVATPISVSSHYYLNDGDYVELLAYQNSGGALNVNQGVGNTWFSMVREGK